MINCVSVRQEENEFGRIILKEYKMKKMIGIIIRKEKFQWTL